MRAAASSIASGTPSSAAQIRATPSAFSAVSSKRGSAARARLTNSRTAGRRRDRRDGRTGGFGGQPERLDVEDALTAHTQAGATGHEERRVGQVVQEGHDIGSGGEHLLETVEHDEISST